VAQPFEPIRRGIMSQRGNSDRFRHPSRLPVVAAASQLRQPSAIAMARLTARSASANRHVSKRARGLQRVPKLPFIPPEDWYDPSELVETTDRQPRYRVVVQNPGRGYRHVLSAQEVTRRLGQLPSHFLKPLEVVQFSRMTRKKQSLPCYGMQWGSTLYLYPIEESLVEYYSRPPKPAQISELRSFGAQWIHEGGSSWKLVWTLAAIKDFYLNNILLHELAHLLDNRNTRPLDRERFAEWFAVYYGVRSSSRLAARRQNRVRRRHDGRR